MKVSAVLKEASARLEGSQGAAVANIEARALLSHALAVDRAWLIAHSCDSMAPASLSKFENMLERRLKGEPVAYILGFREFYGENFKVSNAVLIPRPETELLVDLVIERIPENGKVLDLGTGSGAIAVTIARQRKHAKVKAVEKSSAALAVACENGKGLPNLLFLESDWFDALHGEKFDFIVSNPPYIAEGDRHLGDLKYEPALALTSGKDGLDAIRKIISEAPFHLEKGGWLLFEHGYDQGESCRNLLSGAFSGVNTWKDLSGLERVSGGRLTG